MSFARSLRRKRNQALFNDSSGISSTFARKLGASDQFGEAVLIGNEDVQRMSDMLLKLVEPYADGTSIDELRSFLYVGAMAWNLSLFPVEQRSAEMKEILQTFPKKQVPQEELGVLLEELIRRKEALFAHHKRLIVDFELKDGGDNFHLSVASAVTEHNKAGLRKWRKE